MNSNHLNCQIFCKKPKALLPEEGISLMMVCKQILVVSLHTNFFIYQNINYKQWACLIGIFPCLKQQQLHCTALHCSALHCTEVHCIALHCMWCVADLSRGCLTTRKAIGAASTQVKMTHCQIKSNAMPCNVVKCSALWLSYIINGNWFCLTVEV